MGKKYAVSPRRAAGAGVFVATFYNAVGARVTRSLGTDSEDMARALCVGLVALRNGGVRTEAQALALDVFVAPGCLPLYFGEAAAVSSHVELPADIVQTLAALSVAAPDAVASIEIPAEILEERAALRRALAHLRATVGVLQQDLAAKTEELAALGRTALAHAAKASAGAPTFAAARVKYLLHLKATVQKPSGYTRPLDRLVIYLAEKYPEIANVADVRPGHIMSFLDAKTDLSDGTKRAIRRRNLRVYTGRFFNWCAQTYSTVSPMSGVKTVSKAAVQRERGEIDWHALAEIQAALAALPNGYWRALVGVLAFAGLQLAELCWLRRQDVVMTGPRGARRATLWVTTVSDPGDKRVRHLLKTGNRQRHVDVHPRYLLPLLERHLKSTPVDDYFLFRMPVQRKRRGFDDQGGRWQEITLSTFLRGHPGGKDRLPTVGLLPAGMNAKSLRRTFGSLLIRSGKSTEQVAAAMGNTPAVVREHYARILGCEVDVDF